MDIEIRLAERAGLDSQALLCRAGRHIVNEVREIKRLYNYMPVVAKIRICLKSGGFYDISYRGNVVDLIYRYNLAAKVLGRCSYCLTITNPEHFLERLESFYENPA